MQGHAQDGRRKEHQKVQGSSGDVARDAAELETLRREVVGVESRSRERRLVSVDPRRQRREPLRPLRPHDVVALEEAAPQLEFGGERRRLRGRLRGGREDTLGPRDERVRFRLLRLQGHVGERPLDPRGELTDRPRRRLLAGRERYAGGFEGLPEMEQGGAPEGPLRPVVKARRDDADRRRTREGRRGAQRNARRAGLERPELRIAVRLALGTDRDRATAGEHRPRRLEGFAVVRRIGAFVLTPMHRNGLERPAKDSDHRHPEQRRFGEERDTPWGEAEQEPRIDQTVGVVQHEDHRPLPGHALQARDLDPAEEDAENETEEPSEERPHGVGSPPPALSPRQAA